LNYQTSSMRSFVGESSMNIELQKSNLLRNVEENS